MRLVSVCMVGLALLLWPARASAQTAEIQSEIERLLEKWRKAASKDKDGKEPTLEELLQEALKHNAEIRQAEAHVREAEAKLSTTRLLVLQKVVQAHLTIGAARAAFKESELRWKQATELFGRKVISLEELRSAELTLQKFKAELAKAEAELPFLLGQPREVKGFPVSPMTGLDRDVAPEMVRRLYLDLLGRLPTKEEVKEAIELHQDVPAIVNTLIVSKSFADSDKADGLRKYLDTPVKADFNKVPAREMLEFLKRKTKGMNLHINYAFPEDGVTLELSEPVPLAAVFQYLEDTFPVRFVLREYGIVAIEREFAPPGAVSVLQIWRSKDAKKPKK